MNSQYSTIFSTGTTIISNTLLSNCQVDCLTFIWYQHNHLMNTFGSAHCYHCYRGGKISWPPQHHPPHSSLSVCYPPSTYHHISGLRSYHSQIPKLSILQPPSYVQSLYLSWPSIRNRRSYKWVLVSIEGTRIIAYNTEVRFPLCSRSLDSQPDVF